MVVAGGTKMSAGSDGKVASHQTPWQQAHVSRWPPRPIGGYVQVIYNRVRPELWIIPRKKCYGFRFVTLTTVEEADNTIETVNAT